MEKVDLSNIRPYGDRLNDGMVELSFTFPIPPSAEAKEAARKYVEQLGFKEANVVWMEGMGESFTFFVVYAKSEKAIDMRTVRVPKIKYPIMDYKTLTAFMERVLTRPLVVVGACTGSDAHTVGIDAIFNMKGYNMDYGLERYPLFKAINLRAQVDNRDLVKKAVELGADAILVSQIVTQRNVHVENLKELKRIIDRTKGLKPHLIKIVGGPRIDHAFARKIGFDAGFGPGTLPSHVASYIVHEYLRRVRRAPKGRATGGLCRG
jgi:beta-lysine 5,6-aminomutase beta subunit